MDHGQLILIRKGSHLEPAIFNKYNDQGEAEVLTDRGDFFSVAPDCMRSLSSFAQEEDEGLGLAGLLLAALSSAGVTAAYCWWLWG